MGTAVLLIVVVRFVIPNNLDLQETVYYHDATTDQVLTAALLEADADPSFVLADITAVEKAVAGDRAAVGLVFTDSPLEPQVILVTNTRVSEQQLNIFRANLEQILIGTTSQNFCFSPSRC